jgi:diguanylate cyclase (GGDEF)-like protein
MQSERSTDAFRTLAARALALEDAQAQRDALTGLPTGPWFDDQLATWLKQAAETKTALTILLAEVDGLEAIRRAHGEAASDRVLASVSACIARRLRARDLLARQAGAAFAALLARVPAAVGPLVAERLREGVAEEQHVAARGHAPPRVTLSIGCVTVERGGILTRQRVMEIAERALATAKRDGRDRVASLLASAAADVAGPETET